MQPSASNLSLQHRPKGSSKWTIALSLAANRASKVALLRADGSARCHEMADRFEEYLRGDVEAFLAKHSERPEFRAALMEAAQLGVPESAA